VIGDFIIFRTQSTFLRIWLGDSKEQLSLGANATLDILDWRPAGALLKRRVEQASNIPMSGGLYRGR
jgi:hypothetical protein